MNIENYTIPKINRELKHKLINNALDKYYTIPKTNRELKRYVDDVRVEVDYTIPNYIVLIYCLMSRTMPFAVR